MMNYPSQIKYAICILNLDMKSNTIMHLELK